MLAPIGFNLSSTSPQNSHWLPSLHFPTCPSRKDKAPVNGQNMSWFLYNSASYIHLQECYCEVWALWPSSGWIPLSAGWKAYCHLSEVNPLWNWPNSRKEIQTDCDSFGLEPACELPLADSPRSVRPCWEGPSSGLRTTLYCPVDTANSFSSAKTSGACGNDCTMRLASCTTENPCTRNVPLIIYIPGSAKAWENVKSNRIKTLVLK